MAMGNVTVFLVLPLALAWRYRDHSVAGGLAVGSLVAVKLLLHLVGDETAGPRSLTVTTLAKSLGLPHGAGHALQWGLGLLLLALAAQLARGTDGDRRAFSLVVAAGLVLTRVAWPHYFLFLLVPSCSCSGCSRSRSC
jgi:hypothetical protein